MNKKIDRIVIDAYKNGDSITEISRRYNISRQGIYNILNRNEINYKKQKNIINFDVLKEELKYNKIKYIMDKYNISYSQMKRIMENENIKKYEIMNDVLNIADVKRLYCDIGMSDIEIGRIFNCSQYTVRSFRWKNNIYNKNRQWQKLLTKKLYLQKKREGKTLKQISAETGFPYHIVAKAKKLYEHENKKFLDN